MKEASAVMAARTGTDGGAALTCSNKPVALQYGSLELSDSIQSEPRCKDK